MNSVKMTEPGALSAEHATPGPDMPLAEPGRRRALASNIGLLVLRLGVGARFIHFGLGKFLKGPELWAKLGGSMEFYGIHFWPALWGFMAAFSEFAGGVSMALGLFVRPFAAMLVFTMITASLTVGAQSGFAAAAHSTDMGIVFLSIAIMGGGDYALGRRIRVLKDRWFR